nr:hypothetical protein CFP56_31774 [Quercus suber]
MAPLPEVLRTTSTGDPSPSIPQVDPFVNRNPLCSLPGSQGNLAHLSVVQPRLPLPEETNADAGLPELPSNPFECGTRSVVMGAASHAVPS